MDAVLCCVPMWTLKGGRLREMACETQLNNKRLKDAQMNRTPGWLPNEVLSAQRHRLLQTLASLVDLKREELVNEVEHLLREGLIIQAIKRYRELSGSGLREAKAAVEVIEARLRSRHLLPEETAPRPPAWRSWTWLMVAAVVGGLGLLLFLGSRR